MFVLVSKYILVSCGPKLIAFCTIQTARPIRRWGKEGWLVELPRQFILYFLIPENDSIIATVVRLYYGR
jgi:hypothetical protein